MIRRTLSLALCAFLFVPYVWAEDMAHFKAQIIQLVKEHETEIYSEAMKEFQNMDTDGNGYVYLEEFINFQSYGSAKQKEQVFHVIDVNRDGKLTRDELWNFMYKKMQALR